MNYCELLSHYKSDLSPDISLLDEAIETLESYFTYISGDELLHRNRPLAIAYLALKEIKDKQAVRHGYWIRPSALTNPYCSECKQYEESGKEKPFCSECGARMIDEMKYKMLYHSAFPDGKEQKNGQD